MDHGSENRTSEADSGTALSCQTSVADDCARNPQCDQLLETAVHDAFLCPSYVNKCGSYDLVFKQGIDTVERLYFREGQLVARVFSSVTPARSTCEVGPASFVVPACDDAAAQPLAVCGPSPR